MEAPFGELPRAFWDALMDDAIAGYAFIDRDLGYVRVNRVLSTLNRTPLQERAGPAAREAISVMLPLDIGVIHQVLATGTALLDREVTSEPPAEPGTTRTWQVNYYPVRSTAGEVLGALAVVDDVTERRRAEAVQRLLVEASTRLSLSLDYDVTLTEIVRLAVPMLADLCAVDVVAEGGLLKRLGVYHWDPEKNALAEELSRLIDANPPRARGSPIMDCIRTRRGVLIPHVTFTHIRASVPDPAYSDLLCRIGLTSSMYAPMVARDQVKGVLLFGQTTAGRGFGQNDLALAEEIGRRAGVAYENASLFREAERSIALRDDFLSIAAHELRTPLTSLMLQLEILGRLAASGHAGTRLKEGIAVVGRQADCIRKVVGNVLDVSRMATDHVKLEIEPVDLCAIVSDEIARLEPFASQGHSPIEFRNDRPVVGEWDRVRLEQVATNLLSNAVKYGAGHPIEVEITVHDEKAHLIVCDRGIGISADDVQRIFGRFERAVSSRQYGGLGLGLYITRRLVEAHGGTIDVESEPGRGSTFTVHLPLKIGARPFTPAG